jgi:phosphatidylglycerophosphatase A
MKFSADPKQIFSHPAHILAFGFGSGLSPVAPGTMGTLATIPLYVWMAPLSLPMYTLSLCVLIILSIMIAGRSAELLGVHDHSGIVIDEVCGYLVTMMFAPFAWQWVLVGFILFRIFDIAKPRPIGFMDKSIGGGLGIVVDDLMAGIYAAICLQIIIVLVA